MRTSLTKEAREVVSWVVQYFLILILIFLLVLAVRTGYGWSTEKSKEATSQPAKVISSAPTTQPSFETVKAADRPAINPSRIVVHGPGLRADPPMDLRYPPIQKPQKESIKEAGSLEITIGPPASDPHENWHLFWDRIQAQSPSFPENKKVDEVSLAFPEPFFGPAQREDNAGLPGDPEHSADNRTHGEGLSSPAQPAATKNHNTTPTASARSASERANHSMDNERQSNTDSQRQYTR